MTSRSAQPMADNARRTFGKQHGTRSPLRDGYIRTNAGEHGMWNKLRITAMVASLLAGTAALAYAQSSSTLGTGGSTAGGGSTSTTLGTRGSAAGGRTRPRPAPTPRTPG